MPGRTCVLVLEIIQHIAGSKILLQVRERKGPYWVKLADSEFPCSGRGSDTGTINRNRPPFWYIGIENRQEEGHLVVALVFRFAEQIQHIAGLWLVLETRECKETDWNRNDIHEEKTSEHIWIVSSTLLLQDKLTNISSGSEREKKKLVPWSVHVILFDVCMPSSRTHLRAKHRDIDIHRQPWEQTSR